MKIRYGFVSNSSSSSFTCDVCGETQSGMDMGLSEAGMVRCRADRHTFCENHKLSPTLTIEDKRNAIINATMARKYYKPEENQKRADYIKTVSDDGIENEFEGFNSDKLFPCFCPLCQLTDVTDYDVARYFMVKNGFKTTKEVAATLKSEFGTYEAFNNFIRPPKV